MSNTKVHGRQWPVTAQFDINTAVIGITAALQNAATFTIKLPPGALLDNITLDTVIAFDNATSAAVTVVDDNTSTAGSQKTFVNAADVKSAGRETVAGIGAFYPNGGTLTVSVASVGDGTVGRAIGNIEYVVLGRSNETISN